MIYACPKFKHKDCALKSLKIQVLIPTISIKNGVQYGNSVAKRGFEGGCFSLLCFPLCNLELANL